MAEEGHAVLHLLPHGVSGLAVGGMEGLVVAIGAAARAQRTIAVLAGEARVGGDLLDAPAAMTAHEGGKVEIEIIHQPLLCSEYEHKSNSFDNFGQKK